MVWIALALAGLSCTRHTEPTGTEYQVRGVLIGTAFEGEAAIIDHEEIPGLMPAMRMTLRLRDASLLNSLQEGEKGLFTLFVTDTETVITKVERLPVDSPLELAPPS